MITDNLAAAPSTARRDEKAISLMLALLMVYYPIVDALNSVTNLVFYKTPFDTLAVMAAVVLLTYKAWPRLLVRAYKPLLICLWIFFLLCLAAMLINYRNFSEVLTEVKNYLDIVLLFVPMFLILGFGVNDYPALFKYLGRLVPVAIMAGLIQYIVLVSTNVKIIDNMSYSYALLPSVLVALYLGFERRKLLYLIFAGLGLGLLLASGTRGPLVCLAAYIGLYIGVNLRQVKVLIASLVGGGAFFGWISSDKYLPSLIWIRDQLSLMKVSTRVMDHLIENNYLNTHSRDIYYELAKSGITHNPIFGNGILGDRLVLTSLSGMPGSYAHNIFLEILCQFGVIIGSVFLLLLLCLIINAYLKATKHGKDLILLIIPLALVKLLLSGSYLEEPYFFLLLGICLKSLFAHVHSSVNDKSPEIMDNPLKVGSLAIDFEQGRA